MGIVKFDPFRGFESLAHRMNTVLNDFEKGFSVEYGSFAPRIDIYEDEKQVYLHAELPGVKKEDVKITINEDNLLTIRGEKRREEKDEETIEKRSYIRIERSFGEFTRSFILPDNVKKDSISAKYEDGILTMTLEKAEPAKPKEMEISIA